MKYNYLITTVWLLKQFQVGGNKNKWNTLVHNGVLFPPEYIKHDVPLVYDNQRIILDKEKRLERESQTVSISSFTTE